MATLNQLLSMNTLEIVLLQGANQIGKTTLINEFTKRKYKAYYSVQNSTNTSNTSLFISEMTCQGLINNHSEIFLDSVLKIILTNATKDKFIFAIDNANLIQRNFPELLDNLLEILDAHKTPLRLLLIFSGDDLTYIRSKLHNFKINFSEMNLVSLSYHESCEYFNYMDNEEKVLLYGITNGHPLYLSYIDQSKNLKDNLFNLFYSENSPLLDIGNVILSSLFRQPSLYHAILAAVANGASHMTDIARETNIDDNKLSKYISVLLKLKLLKKLVPFQEQETLKQHKKTYYILDDMMLVFWYKFVFPYSSSIKTGLGKQILRNQILPNILDYAAYIFLHICYQHMCKLRTIDGSYINFDKVGFEWNKEDCFNDFKIVAKNNTSICYAQCVWSIKKVSPDLLTSLQTNYYNHELTNHYIIFSRKGFTEKALSLNATMPELRLISLRYLK